MSRPTLPRPLPSPQFPMDVISLLPLWAVHFTGCQLSLLSCSVSDCTLWQVLGFRLLGVAYLLTNFIQLLKSMTLFTQPKQAQPFHALILQLKYAIQIIIILASCLSIFAMLWITAGCQNR